VAVKNYSTSIPTARTVGEVQAMLGRAGAIEVMLMFTDRTPSGLRFTLETPAGKQAFAMPVAIDAVHAALRKHEQERRIILRPGQRTREHAERVAWRVARDWLDAQLALVEAGLAALDEAFLPYLLVSSEQTLYQRFAATGLRELEAT
jgi:hypothetical protein